MLRCPACRAENSDNALVCLKCSQPLAAVRQALPPTRRVPRGPGRGQEEPNASPYISAPIAAPSLSPSDELGRQLYCSECDGLYEASMRYCPKHGITLHRKICQPLTFHVVQRCRACDRPAAAGFAFCGYCGTRLDEVPSRLTAYHRSFEEPRALDADGLSIGRQVAGLFLPNDAPLSNSHARIFWSRGMLHVVDLDTEDGTYIRLRVARRLEPDDHFKIGGNILRFVSVARAEVGATRIVGYGAPRAVSQLVSDDGTAYRLGDETFSIGRTQGDITFPSDVTVSRRHAAVLRRDDAYWLEDQSSLNGTYLRLRDAWPLYDGDEMQVGDQTFVIRVNVS